MGRLATLGVSIVRCLPSALFRLDRGGGDAPFGCGGDAPFGSCICPYALASSPPSHMSVVGSPVRVFKVRVHEGIVFHVGMGSLVTAPTERRLGMRRPTESVEAQRAGVRECSEGETHAPPTARDALARHRMNWPVLSVTWAPETTLRSHGGAASSLGSSRRPRRRRVPCTADALTACNAPSPVCTEERSTSCQFFITTRGNDQNSEMEFGRWCRRHARPRPVGRLSASSCGSSRSR